MDGRPRFPVGDDIRAIVAEWVDFLRGQKALGRRRPALSALDLVVPVFVVVWPFFIQIEFQSRTRRIRSSFISEIVARGIEADRVCHFDVLVSARPARTKSQLHTAVHLASGTP